MNRFIYFSDDLRRWNHHRLDVIAVKRQEMRADRVLQILRQRKCFQVLSWVFFCVYWGRKAFATWTSRIFFDVRIRHRRQHDLHCVMRVGSWWACVECSTDLCWKIRSIFDGSLNGKRSADRHQKLQLNFQPKLCFQRLAEIKQEMSTHRLRKSLQLRMFNLMTVVPVEK